MTRKTSFFFKFVENRELEKDLIATFIVLYLLLFSYKGFRNMKTDKSSITFLSTFLFHYVAFFYRNLTVPNLVDLANI